MPVPGNHRQLEAIERAQPDVGDQAVKLLVQQPVARVLKRAARNDLAILPLEGHPHSVEQTGLIVDQKHSLNPLG